MHAYGVPEERLLISSSPCGRRAQHRYGVDVRLISSPSRAIIGEKETTQTHILIDQIDARTGVYGSIGHGGEERVRAKEREREK